MKKLLKILGWMLAGIFVFLLIGTIVMGIIHNSRVLRAETEQEIKQACMNDWYEGMSLKSLPVKCLKYYK